MEKTLQALQELQKRMTELKEASEKLGYYDIGGVTLPGTPDSEKPQHDELWKKSFEIKQELEHIKYKINRWEEELFELFIRHDTKELPF